MLLQKVLQKTQATWLVVEEAQRSQGAGGPAKVYANF